MPTNKIEFEGFLTDTRFELSAQRQSVTLTVQEGKGEDRFEPGRIMLFSMSTGPSQKNLLGVLSTPSVVHDRYKVTIERL